MGWKTLLMLLLSAGLAGAAENTVVLDDFESGLSAAWDEKRFEGATEYRIIEDDEGHCLQAVSRGQASGLVYEREYSLRDYPLLAWRWRVSNVLEEGDARTKEGDDYAARVYVIFPHWFPPRTRSINYIWANKLPKGSSIPNSFYANAVMVAVQSGGEKAGEWVSERRNVLEDYRRIFGEDPPEVGAIAVMTDTDNTGGAATACYDDLRILGE